MVVLSTYPVFPRRSGGQLRTFHLHEQLSKFHKVTIISLNDFSYPYERHAGNLTEISVPMTYEHLRRVREVEYEAGISVSDILMNKTSHWTPEYHRIAYEHMKKADIIVASQPYLFHLMNRYAGKKKLFYDAHNVEYVLKTSMLSGEKSTKQLLENVWSLEKMACEQSDAISVCSEKDAEQMIKLYGIDRSKLVLVPNGVDLASNSYVDYAARQRNKEKLGLQEPIVAFIGSWHKPNREALEEIIKFAKPLADVKFFIMGGQSLAYRGRKTPENVMLLGIVDEDLKQTVYSVSDLAINPMIHGSGTNLKIAEYMANGVPVLSTPVGARGYDITDNVPLVLGDVEDFPREINSLIDDRSLLEQLSANGRLYVEEHFSWEQISRNLLNVL